MDCSPEAVGTEPILERKPAVHRKVDADRPLEPMILNERVDGAADATFHPYKITVASQVLEPEDSPLIEERIEPEFRVAVVPGDIAREAIEVTNLGELERRLKRRDII